MLLKSRGVHAYNPFAVSPLKEFSMRFRLYAMLGSLLTLAALVGFGRSW